MKKILFGIPICYLFLITIVTASIIITGVVIARMTMPRKIDIGQIKVNEKVTRTLAEIFQPISVNFTLKTTCIGEDGIKMYITKPDTSPQELNLNGNTTINKEYKDEEISIGNISLEIRGISQTIFNCTIVPMFDCEEDEIKTNITWVDMYE